jgi:hypothetical protein
MEPRVLRYDDRGSGETIVLVPGGLSGWLSWITHEERLVYNYRVVRVHPIHNELGSAGRPGQPGYTAAVEREALRMTLDELGSTALTWPVGREETRPFWNSPRSTESGADAYFGGAGRLLGPGAARRTSRDP